MHRQHPLILLVLVAYIFSPTLLAWIFDPTSVWYKPFIIWLGVVIVAYLVQSRGKYRHDV